MPRRKTHEEYVQQVTEKAPHVVVKEEYRGKSITLNNTIQQKKRYIKTEIPVFCK